MKWRTKDGDVIEVSSMEDSHLNNCIKLIQKRIKTYEVQGRDPKQSKETLKGLMLERTRRNAKAFAVDITDLSDESIEHEMEFIFGEKKRPRTFLDMLGEL